MEKYKQILLGLVIGAFLVLTVGFYDLERFSDTTTHYWGTDNDTSITWDNTNSEFDITTTGEVRITASAVSDGAYGMHVTGAIAGATKSEGVSAYFAGAITGNTDGPLYNLGSWFDITDGTPTAGPIAAMEAGIYTTADADLSAVYIVGLQIQTMVNSTSAPSAHYMMRFNTNQAGDTPDAWFMAANSECIAFSAGANTGATKLGDIAISIVGYGTCYIRVYDGKS